MIKKKKTKLEPFCELNNENEAESNNDEHLIFTSQNK